MNVRGNWQYALLALLLAVISWYWVSGREKVDTWVELPLELTGMPADMVIREGLEKTIAVRVRGPQGLLRNIETKSMAYPLDLSKLKKGVNVIPIDPDQVPLAGPFEVAQVTPQRLQLKVDHIIEKVTPVVAVWTGEVGEDVELVLSEVTPETAVIRGAEQLVEGVATVSTQELSVNATMPLTVEETVALDAPAEVQVEPKEVDVRIVFGLKRVERELSLPVRVIAPPGVKVSVKPTKVTLKVDMPVTLARTLENDQEDFGAQLRVRRPLKEGTLQMPYRLILPDGVFRVEAIPEMLDVTIHETQNN